MSDEKPELKLSETESQQTAGLRDRIAAAIRNCPNPLSREQCAQLADAVIRELGLRPDRVGTLTRWVTGWSETPSAAYCNRCGIPHTEGCRRAEDT